MSQTFNDGIGRLTLDRYDFKKHTDGEDFFHNSNSVKLNPPVTIDSVEYDNLQDAVDALNALASEALPEATSSVKGILKINGDLSGDSNSQTVIKIQGVAVSSTPPGADYLLAYNNSNSQWEPINPSIYAWSGGNDLDASSTSSSQTVVQLTGSSGKVGIECATLEYGSSISSPTIQQASTTSSCQDLNITAQSSTSGIHAGGYVNVIGGSKSGPTIKGGVRLKMNLTETHLELTEPALGQRVLALLNGSPITTSQMPVSSGDKVIYIADALTAPAADPIDGFILYSSGGSPYVRTASGDDFAIGSLTNPYTSGTTDENVYTVRKEATTTSSTQTTLLTYGIPSTGAIKVVASFVGKQTSSGDCVGFTKVVQYVRNGGSPSIVGTLDTLESRVSAGASGWTEPTITVLLNSILVKTGANSGTTIRWIADIKVIHLNYA